MKIVVVSDIHRNIETLSIVKNLHPRADLFLDAGDSQLDEIDLLPFLTVKGNCDFFIKNNFRIIQLNGLKIFITHGNKYLLTDEVLSQIAKNNDCNMIIFGHTHVPYSNKVNGVYILNPGSISRGRSSLGNTYAIINFTTYEDLKVEIKKI